MRVDRTVTTAIDPELCTGCGLCIEVCPSETITLLHGKAVVSGKESLNCGHCAAVCPTGAVAVGAIDPDMSAFQTFQEETTWSPHGRYDTAALVNLMRSRRSCRNFRQQPVARDILEDLIRIGITAPSGSNCQMWTFTVLPDPAAVRALAARIGDFFRKLNRLAQKKWLRKLLKGVGRPELDHYYRNHFESIARGLLQWDNGGRDLLFHNAPAAIVVAAKNQASCPAEDALLATQNILLAAHSMGLGTCLIGFAIAAMHRSDEIKALLRLPADETPYAVIALGYPREKYQRVTGRKKATVRYIDFISPP
ncbi:nitroreductase family protein [Desulfatitalea alkaliphila]|uniref:Nitroreductase family protein n=1 Tax=Desulfatitalea alkaliphila TaxID=2929485 RepID=A0AA41R3U8_9BACT|nr:nitroreductase family protein [Desulfatitalea alkaliphila]MCJ8501096.1 nitroreductase family protein [Desulfatitalea alkaliphila]